MICESSKQVVKPVVLRISFASVILENALRTATAAYHLKSNALECILSMTFLQIEPFCLARYTELQ